MCCCAEAALRSLQCSCMLTNAAEAIDGDVDLLGLGDLLGARGALQERSRSSQLSARCTSRVSFVLRLGRHHNSRRSSQWHNRNKVTGTTHGDGLCSDAGSQAVALCLAQAQRAL